MQRKVVPEREVGDRFVSGLFSSLQPRAYLCSKVKVVMPKASFKLILKGIFTGVWKIVHFWEKFMETPD